MMKISNECHNLEENNFTISQNISPVFRQANRAFIFTFCIIFKAPGMNEILEMKVKNLTFVKMIVRLLSTIFLNTTQ